jgi:hypothetical protein
MGAATVAMATKDRPGRKEWWRGLNAVHISRNALASGSLCKRKQPWASHP